MRDTFRTLLRPANLARGLAVVIALGVGAAIVISPDSGGGDPSLDVNAAAPRTLNGDEQRDALRRLGTDLCEPETAAERARQLELRAQLTGSLDDDDIAGFWTRAVSGKTSAQIETAFFGCESLTDWMRDRAMIGGVDVPAIIAAEIGDAGDEPAEDVASRTDAVELEGVVTDIVDGDTIKVESEGFETVVRLLGIDTPETVDPSEPVQCHGPEATKATERLVPIGASVRLQTDPSQDTRDRYGRLLAYVYAEGAAGADSVNHELVREGHATVYVWEPSGPFRDHEAFAESESAARKRGVGLWGPPCNGVTNGPPPEPKPDSGLAAPPAALATIPDPGVETCDPNYEGTCVPEVGVDLDCKDISGAVTVVGSDHHGFDGDGDGQGCESAGAAPTPGPSPPPPPEPVAAASAPAAEPACDPNYEGACVPEVGVDLDCKDISGAVTVVGSDHHRFDGDGDGVGCES